MYREVADPDSVLLKGQIWIQSLLTKVLRMFFFTFLESELGGCNFIRSDQNPMFSSS